MINRKAIILLICSSSSLYAENSTLSFGYTENQLQEQQQIVERTIRNHFIKKYVFIGATISAVGAVCYTGLKNSYFNNNMITKNTYDACMQKIGAESPKWYANAFLNDYITFDMYQNIAQEITAQSTKMGWIEWMSHGAKFLSFEVVKSALVTGLLSSYGSRLQSLSSDITLTWYVNNYTQLHGTVNALHKKSELLPLEENAQEQLDKIDVLIEKIEMVIPHLVKTIAYMNYRKELTEQYDSMTAVRMEKRINHIEKIVKDFCDTLKVSLHSYKKDVKGRMELAIKISTTVDILKERISEDLRTFEEYELYEL